MTNYLATLIITLTTNVVPIDMYVEALDGETVEEFVNREVVAHERVIVVKKYISRVTWKGRVVDTLLESDIVEYYDRNRTTSIFEVLKNEETD